MKQTNKQTSLTRLYISCFAFTVHLFTFWGTLSFLCVHFVFVCFCSQAVKKSLVDSLTEVCRKSGLSSLEIVSYTFCAMLCGFHYFYLHWSRQQFICSQNFLFFPFWEQPRSSFWTSCYFLCVCGILYVFIPPARLLLSKSRHGVFDMHKSCVQQCQAFVHNKLSQQMINHLKLIQLKKWPKTNCTPFIYSVHAQPNHAQMNSSIEHFVGGFFL